MSDRERYESALHGMQTGVATLMNYDDKETSPKHLRVGVNSAMSDHGALVRLLIDKGLFTLEEYQKYLADAMEAERGAYAKRLKDHFGTDTNINLL